MHTRVDTGIDMGMCMQSDKCLDVSPGCASRGRCLRPAPVSGPHGTRHAPQHVYIPSGRRRRRWVQNLHRFAVRVLNTKRTRNAYGPNLPLRKEITLVVPLLCCVNIKELLILRHVC